MTQEDVDELAEIMKVMIDELGVERTRKFFDHTFARVEKLIHDQEVRRAH